MTTRITAILLCFGLLAFAACTSSKLANQPIPQNGMYKVTILYPGGEDKKFDFDYYQQKHMPMVAGFIGANLAFYEIDKGISGRTANDKPAYMAIGYFYVKDIDAYNKAIAQNRDAIVSDFKNYTNIQPLIQISEVKQVVRSNK